MPKVGEVLETSLYVEDLARSAEFYERVLHFNTIFGNERIVVLSVSGHQVLLLFRKKGSVEPTVFAGGTIPPTDGDGQIHVAFTISADEFEPWRDWLQGNGVDIESVVAWDLGGRSLYFRDPDRHVVELATPGVWPVY